MPCAFCIFEAISWSLGEAIYKNWHRVNSHRFRGFENLSYIIVKDCLKSFKPTSLDNADIYLADHVVLLFAKVKILL